MIAPDHDRRRDLARGDEIIDGDAKLRAIGLAEPADSRRKSLKPDFLLGEGDPTAEMLVLWK